MSFTVSPTWYQEFFTELPNEFWRQAMPPGSAELEVDFAEREFGLTPGAGVLDVPCGSGRHALVLAARGYRVTGVDISAEAIGHAAKEAEAAGVEMDLRVGDLRELPGGSEYDAALCLGNSFGYLDLAGTEAFLTALAGALRPGGGLLIDCSAAAEALLPGYQDGSDTMEIGDISMAATREYDVVHSRLYSHYTFTRGDESVDVTAAYYVYTCAQIAALLERAGFAETAFHGDLDGSPARLGSGRLLLTARRS